MGALCASLKILDDAFLIRRRVLPAFEHAEREDDPERRQAWLNFVVVGGGSTGVELAGTLIELARHTLSREFRRSDPRHASVRLIEAGPRLLPARTVQWAAGVAASSVGRLLGTSLDRTGRVQVLPDLSLPGHPEVFVIGDLATIAQADGKPVPGVAPAAKQMGAHVGTIIRAQLQGNQARPPFRYRDDGALATIGRMAAVAQFGKPKLSGFPAWSVWLLAHIFFLIGFRNRLVVMLD